MKFIDLFLPVVTLDFEATIDFYKQITGLGTGITAAHDGYHLSTVGSFVILGAEDHSALEIPRQVHAIFLVEGVRIYWESIQEYISEVIVPLSVVSTGTRFIIRQKDGKVVEYLELNNTSG